MEALTLLCWNENQMENKDQKIAGSFLGFGYFSWFLWWIFKLKISFTFIISLCYNRVYFKHTFRIGTNLVQCIASLGINDILSIISTEIPGMTTATENKALRRKLHIVSKTATKLKQKIKTKNKLMKKFIVLTLTSGNK